MKIKKDTPKEAILKLGSECERCGHCCSYGGCFVLEHEIDDIAKALDKTEQEIIDSYLIETELFNRKLYKTKIRAKKDRPYGKCIFLAKDECSIHERKPLHCRIGNCGEYGGDVMEWYYLNYVVDDSDPESIRQWALRLEHKPTIEGGHVRDLVKDHKELGKYLTYETVRKDPDWEEVLGIDKLRDQMLKEMRENKTES